MLIEIITHDRAIEIFRCVKRLHYFGEEGLKKIVDYLHDVSEETGEHIEFDPIAICGDFSRFDSLDDYNRENKTNFSSLDELREEHDVIELSDDSFIVRW